MFLALVRIYLSLFQKNKIFENSEDSLTLFFNMMCWLLCLLIHLIFIGKVLIREKRIVFYILNGIIISILLLDKVVGFKEAWNRRDKIYLNFLLTVISILGMGYLMA